jgi:molybdate transport system substrate-binding protein
MVLMTPSLTLLAAGSLKSAFIPLLARFQQQTGIPVEVHFGPAGLLRERIEGGEPCSVFASANSQHPQALRQAGLAGACYLFARNQLMLTARHGATTETREWMALLSDPDLRLAISTPGCDPSGDYTWQLFSHIEERCPGVGAAIMARARPLVGGRDSLPVPAGEIAGAWLIRENLTDLFIGYAHYAARWRRAAICARCLFRRRGMFAATTCWRRLNRAPGRSGCAALSSARRGSAY